MHNHADHFIPWICWVVFGVAGMLLHAYISETWSRAGMVTLILLGTVGMTWSVWHTNAYSTPVARWHGVLSTALGGGWLAVCTITGMVTVATQVNPWVFSTHGFTIATYLVLGPALAAVWNTRINHRHRSAELAELLAQQQPEETPMERAGHKGAVMRLRRLNQFRSEGTITLAPGDTLAEFQRDLRTIEGCHGFPPNSMTVTQRRGIGNALHCDVTVMHLNPIEDPQPWPGLVVGGKPLTRSV